MELANLTGTQGQQEGGITTLMNMHVHSMNIHRPFLPLPGAARPGPWPYTQSLCPPSRPCRTPGQQPRGTGRHAGPRARSGSSHQLGTLGWGTGFFREKRLGQQRPASPAPPTLPATDDKGGEEQ